MTGCECADPVVFGHTSCPDGFWHSGETTCSPGCLPQHASPAIAAIAAIAALMLAPDTPVTLTLGLAGWRFAEGAAR
jgi:hypothetical protein